MEVDLGMGQTLQAIARNSQDLPFDDSVQLVFKGLIPKVQIDAGDNTGMVKDGRGNYNNSRYVIGHDCCTADGYGLVFVGKKVPPKPHHLAVWIPPKPRATHYINAVP